ncbi:hypothetical protein [Streptomyces sp. NPDC003077]|uniref:hypothetical protein n=1 Tax=Streptomyces sp. NPDC003077 TaxID=3154443 RepID=UPI0033AAABE8
MNRKIRAAAVAALSLAAVAGAAGTASAGGSDNHHESKPKIDCRNSSYGPAALLSPATNYDNQGHNARQCNAVDKADHPSETWLLGLINVT